MKIIVFGAGYVGCVTAACLAKMGHVVNVIDTILSKVETIRKGQSPVLEQDLAEMIAEAVAGGRCVENRIQHLRCSKQMPP